MADIAKTREQYALARDSLLAHITSVLEQDERIAAAWLVGSYSRGEQDDVSDIDLFVVVNDDAEAALCRYTRKSGSGAPAERLTLFCQFGNPVNIHENHANAPEGGSFSAVLYRDPPVIVDWTLVPFHLAWRGAETRLLFDHKGIPRVPPTVMGFANRRTDDQDEQAAANLLELSERTAFFWMMAAIAAKYIVRGEPEDIQWVLAFLMNIVVEIAQFVGLRTGEITGEGISFHKEPSALLRALCEQVTAWTGGSAVPLAQVEFILSLKMG